MSVTACAHPRYAHRETHTGWSSPRRLSLQPLSCPATACASFFPLAQRPRQLRRRLHLSPCGVCRVLPESVPRAERQPEAEPTTRRRAAAPLSLCKRGQHVLGQRLQHVCCRLWCCSCAPRAACLPRARLLPLPLLLASCRNRETGLVSLLGTAVSGTRHPNCQSSRRRNERQAQGQPPPRAHTHSFRCCASSVRRCAACSAPWSGHHVWLRVSKHGHTLVGDTQSCMASCAPWRA